MPIGIILSLIAFEILLIFVHLAVYATLAAAFGIGGLLLKILFIVLALTFVGSSALSHFYKGKAIDLFYTFSAYWFGLVHFLFVGAVIFYFTVNQFYGRGIYISPALVGGISFGTLFLVHLYGTWNSGHPRITKVKVPFSGIPGFDVKFWKGKKVVFVSDFQLGNIYRENFTSRVVKKIAPLGAYAVFIGGDLYDGVVCDEKKLIAPLGELHPEGGIYFITGNHEHYLSDLPHALDEVRSLGIKVLNDEKAELGGIQIVGVDYLTAHKKENFKKILENIGIDRAKPSILLKHEPNYLDVAEEAGISLDLSGHTHHGQIFPLSFFTWQMYEGFDYGHKRKGGMQVFTSCGVGTWGPPLRLGTKSEILLIEFV
jgi:predicted MPP superfamily phosphohydrolase